MQHSLTAKIPTYLAKAAATAGLPPSSIPEFIGAVAGNDEVALQQIPGVNAEIISDGVLALRHAYADSLRLVYIIAAPFGLVACVLCFFLSDMKKQMTYRVDAPVEDLHAKRPRQEVERDVNIELNDARIPHKEHTAVEI